MVDEIQGQDGDRLVDPIEVIKLEIDGTKSYIGTLQKEIHRLELIKFKCEERIRILEVQLDGQTDT